MPETYNPRERTFIHAPEVKLCPECGQPLPSDVKPMNNIMNSYISSSGNRMVLNSDESTLVIKGVTMYKAKQFFVVGDEHIPVTDPLPKNVNPLIHNKIWKSEFLPNAPTVSASIPNPVIPQDIKIEKTPILGVPVPVSKPQVAQAASTTTSNK